MSQALQQGVTPQSEQELIREYRRLLDAFADSLRADWQVHDQQTGSLTWRYFFRRGTALPTQGWKIHVSVAAIEAPFLFEKVLPLLRARHASFKLPNSVDGITAINYGQGGETQFGKIITVYPNNSEEAASLAQELDQICPHTRGPVVTSDVLLRQGGAVSMRYGSFGGGEIIRDSVGRPSLTVRLPDGSLVKDRYAPGGVQPNYAQELPLSYVLPSQFDATQELSIGRERYLPMALLHSSLISRVYLGLEISNCETVILKTVRRGVGGDLRGHDARDKLRNEYEVLTSLSRFNRLGPQALALSDDDPSVLVLEDIDGVPLHRLPRSEQIRHLPRLAESIARLHQSGFAHRDIKLSNVLVAEGDVRLIDFGLAATLGSARASLDGTGGYVPPEGPGGEVTTAADVYALGACLAHIMLGVDPVMLPDDGGRLIGMLHLIGAHCAASLVKELMAPDARQRPTASTAAARLRDNWERLALELTQSPKSVARRTTSRWSKRVAFEAGVATRFFSQRSEAGKWWRNAHFQSDFACEGINLGAAGIILGLVSIDRALNRTSFNADVNNGAEWLASRAPEPGSAGFFTGDAGVALALAVLARRLSRPELLIQVRSRLEAAASPSQELDLFCGAAGVVWAGCLLAEILGEQWPLDAVQNRAQALVDSVEVRQNVMVWPASEVLEKSDAPYIGAAHGSAGVAMALALYGKRLGHKATVDLAAKTFAGLRTHGCSPDGKTLLLKVGDNPEAAPSGSWCHGMAGYLWCLLQAFGESADLQTEIDWAVETFAEATAKPVGNPTYCHGLSGILELWRMLSVIPRHRKLATRRAAETASMLRLLCQRSGKSTVWCSEEPRVITPDLWIGFLAPATALALYSRDCNSPLLSASWLTNCSSPTSS